MYIYYLLILYTWISPYDSTFKSIWALFFIFLLCTIGLSPWILHSSLSEYISTNISFFSVLKPPIYPTNITIVHESDLWFKSFGGCFSFAYSTSILLFYIPKLIKWHPVFIQNLKTSKVIVQGTSLMDISAKGAIDWTPFTQTIFKKLNK